ncbi:uncharacterized protein [Elaeis guineensis]|uniref:uncharacterized protein n=1 Tax=Elaeis guineensis var. tenera TaxID=51953 RepID=UPI003C6D62EC
MVLLQLFMLQLLWLAPLSSSNMLDPSVLEGNLPQCYNWTPIQYPFGVLRNGSVGPIPLPGFEIRCDVGHGSRPMLKLGSDLYQLLNISLPHGYVRIVSQVTASRCRGNSSGDSLGPYHVPDLMGTPYTYVLCHEEQIHGHQVRRHRPDPRVRQQASKQRVRVLLLGPTDRYRRCMLRHGVLPGTGATGAQEFPVGIHQPKKPRRVDERVGEVAVQQGVHRGQRLVPFLPGRSKGEAG